MISTPHPIEAEEVMAFLDGELPADRAAMVGGHVAECAECGRPVQELRGVSGRLAGWEVEACRLRTVEGKVRRPWWSRRPVWVAGMAAAAGVAALVAVVPRQRELRYGAYAVPARSELQVPATSYDTSASLASPPQGQQGSGLANPGARVNAVITREPMIAHTAQLTLITTDFTHARERLDAILKAHHGYIGQLSANSPTGAGQWIEAVLKVPSRELDASLAELKKLGRVESETRAGEEVTQQYVDLEARLKNARNAEQRLTRVLRERAGKMEDVLAVEKEIARVRGEIEQMEAERKTLSARVEFATISLKVTEEYKAQLQGPESVGTRLGNAAVAGYRKVADGALGMAEFVLEYGLMMLVWAVILAWPARVVWRRLGRASAG